jgi:NADPH-dependent 2,4-dienoyl-CoA reductase/sulfur reductase-like enzyme
MTTRQVDILVVGAGPAGIAAATAAAQLGHHTVVLDDNPGPGGQIWRGGVAAPHKPEPPGKTAALAAFNASGAELLAGRRAVAAPCSNLLQTLFEDAGPPRVELFRWNKLILATGARERFLPFPGWTLPGVFGAGGLEALVKGGFSVVGKRVVVAGTGPLLLAVAAHLRQYGATVICVAEQAPLRQLLPFTATLLGQPGKLLDGARYRVTLRNVPYRTGCWPVSAEGEGRLQSVRLTDGKRIWNEPCDLLACGFHLVPNTELAALLGCRFEGDFVAVDQSQQTSIPNVFAAGEPTAIAGLEAALEDGRIAGLAATGIPIPSRNSASKAFAGALASAFSLRPELRTLTEPSTVVCRCEDVRFEQLQAQNSWTSAKLQTRCGMGPCQGRVCGPAVQTLFGWKPSSVRPPLFPMPVSAFVDEGKLDSPQSTAQNLQETL